MIDANISQIATSFKDTWTKYLSVSPLLELDATWPSVGVLDLLTFSLRLHKELDVQQQILRRGISAYLACMAHDVWQVLKVDVKVIQGEKGIELHASGGPYIPEGEKVCLNIEDDLSKALRELPYPFPVLGEYARPISFDSNVLSLFGLGVLTGLSPRIHGAWEEHTTETFKDAVEKVVKQLARQSADHYARVFPDEPLGQVAEFYLNDLIYPPLMMNEDLPLIRAVDKVVDFFSAYNVNETAICALARNLALSPDDLLSCLGLVLYGAFCSSTPPPEVIATAQAKGKFAGILRRAMTAVRHKMEMPEDWTTAGIQNEDDEFRFEVEQLLGFIPWLTLGIERFRVSETHQQFIPFLRALCEFDIDEAVSIMDKFLEEDPGDIDLRLQRIKLEMLRGEKESTEELLKTLMTEPGANEHPLFFSLFGMCKLEQDDLQSALKFFKAGLNCSNLNVLLESDLANNVAWASLLADETETALEHIELGLEKAPCPVTLLLNKAHILWKIGELEQVEPIRKRLFEIAPADRRVFASLTLTAG